MFCYDIQPCKGVGQIHLGMQRDEIYSFIGDPDRISQPKYSSSGPRESYHKLGLFIEYDSEERCISIEMGCPASPRLFGSEMLGIPFCTVRDFLLSLDQALEVDDDDGATSYKLGVGIWGEGVIEDCNLPVESVIVFQEGYYD